MLKKSLGKEIKLDLACIAVFCYCNPSKLVWDINKNPNLLFERIADLSISSESGKSYHTRFVFDDPNYGTQYILLKNKGTKTDLLKTKIDIPYLMLNLAGEFELATAALINVLKHLEQVKAVQQLDKKIINKLIAYI